MDKELEEKHRDPIRDKCFEEREELRARVAELEEALRPFAELADHHQREKDRTEWRTVYPNVSFELLAAARATLFSSTSEAKEDTDAANT